MMELTEEYKRLVREEIKKSLTWNDEQNMFLNRPKFRNPILVSNRVTFHMAVLVKFRRSFFGTFLEYYNHQQRQNKFWNDTKWELLKYNYQELEADEMKAIIEENNASDDVYTLLYEAVKQKDIIDFDFLYEKITCLRIVNYSVNLVVIGAISNFY